MTALGSITPAWSKLQVFRPWLTESINRLTARGLTQAVVVLTRELGNQAHSMSALDFFWIVGWLCWEITGSVYPQAAGNWSVGGSGGLGAGIKVMIKGYLRYPFL